MSESSSASSRPVECYRFEIDGFDPMLFTSDEMAVTAEGNTYEPLPGLSRGELIIATANEANAFTVTLPATSLIARRTALSVTPRRVVLKFRRYQRTDLDTPTFRLDGRMDSASISGRSCTLKFPDAFTSALAAVLPKSRIQTQCNWNLGDANCGVNLDAFKANVDNIAEVVSFSSVVPGQYIVQASWADDVDPYDPLRWVGGTITGVNGDVRDARTIFEAYFFGLNRFQLRARLVLNRSFDVGLAGTTFTIRPGCDNSFSRCVELENTPRFGGFLDVPTERENPFRVRLNIQRKLP